MKIKISLKDIVYRVVWVLKKHTCEYFCLKPSIFWENCIKQKFSGCPWKFSHRVMYIAPSSGHISLNFNIPFKLFLMRFEVVFWCLERGCCFFWERLMAIHSNSPILYYGFKILELLPVQDDDIRKCESFLLYGVDHYIITIFCDSKIKLQPIIKHFPLAEI